MTTRRKYQQAFSLIELMIALAVVATLAVIAVPAYNSYIGKVRTADTVKDLSTLAHQIEMYRTENRSYPLTLAALGAPAPLDRWGCAYQYLPIDIIPPPSVGQIRKDKNLYPLNTDFDLYSMGPDCQTQTQLTAARARDDIVRADNGAFIGKASDH